MLEEKPTWGLGEAVDGGLLPLASLSHGRGIGPFYHTVGGLQIVYYSTFKYNVSALFCFHEAWLTNLGCSLQPRHLNTSALITSSAFTTLCRTICPHHLPPVGNLSLTLKPLQQQHHRSPPPIAALCRRQSQPKTCTAPCSHGKVPAHCPLGRSRPGVVG